MMMKFVWRSSQRLFTSENYFSEEILFFSSFFKYLEITSISVYYPKINLISNNRNSDMDKSSVHVKGESFIVNGDWYSILMEQHIWRDVYILSLIQTDKRQSITNSLKSKGYSNEISSTISNSLSVSLSPSSIKSQEAITMPRSNRPWLLWCFPMYI